MKKCTYLIFLFLFVLTSCEQEDEIIDLSSDKKANKITICHYSAGTDSWHSITISKKALKAHIAHGDFEGGCDRLTFVPDDAFEYALIDMGYDNEMDDYVLTKNIHLVERLSFCEDTYCRPFVDPPHSIEDFTGIEDFVNLKYFGITGHHFSSLDLSNSIKLEGIGFTDNYEIKNIDLSNNIALKRVFFYNTPIEEFDFSNNPAITFIDIIDNRFLTKVNLKNGNNSSILIYEISFNSDALTCVQVDDAVWSDANWFIADDEYIFSEDCGY